MVHALENPNPLVRRRAAQGLGEAGPSANSALALQGLLRLKEGDPDIKVRNMASWAYDVVASRQMEADPNIWLTEGLAAKELEVRLEAIRRLGAAPSVKEVAITELIRLLNDSVDVIRLTAIDALVEKGRPALPRLSVALRSPRKRVRLAAMLAITRIEHTF